MTSLHWSIKKRLKQGLKNSKPNALHYLELCQKTPFFLFFSMQWRAMSLLSDCLIMRRKVDDLAGCPAFYCTRNTINTTDL